MSLKMRVLVLSSPRTGSQLISQVVHASNTTSSPNSHHLSEFLNSLNYNLFFKQFYDKWHYQRNYEEGMYRIVPLIEDGSLFYKKVYQNSIIESLDLETERRLDLLSKLEGSFVLNHHVMDNVPLAFKIVKKIKFDKIVVCRRNNIRNQVLSYLLARKIGRYVYTSKIPFPEIQQGSLDIDYDLVNDLVRWIVNLERVALKVEHTSMIFEEIESLAPKIIANIIGINNKLSKSVMDLIKTPYVNKPEYYFKSSDLSHLDIYLTSILIG